MTNRRHVRANARRAIAIAVVALGGASAPAVTATAAGPIGTGGTWTVLHYSMADTDLEPYMMTDINEMGDVGSTANLDIVALIDRSPHYGEEPVLDLGDWVGAKAVHIEQGHAEELADLGDIDMGDPATLAGFIADSVAAYPADHYALIISDHGAAWPGVGPDESAGQSVLDLTGLQAGLADGLTAAGIERLDLLGFDACLMAAYEVASALAPYADRLVASSEVEPGAGWDYHSLQVIADDPAATVDDLGVAIVDGFVAGNDAGVTLALLDLTQIPALDEAMASFTAALVERSATLAPDVGRTLAQNPGYGRSPDPEQDHYMTDLGTLAASIGIDALDVADQADAVLRALGDVVVHKGSGSAAPSFSGLSIYFPPSADLFDQSYVYAAPSPSGWVDFLDAYYSAGQGIAEADRPAFLDPEPFVSGDATGLTVEGTVDPAALENVSTATVGYGIQLDDGSVAFFGDEPATVTADGSGLVSGFFDLTVLQMTDGVDTALAYLSLVADDRSDGFGLEVPLAYYPPGWVEGEPYQDVVLSVSVDGDGTIVDETYYAVDPETGATGELYAEPDGIIVPQTLLVAADGNSSWQPTSDVGLYADFATLTLSFEPLESGTPIVVSLGVTDFGGNTAEITAAVAVP